MKPIPLPALPAIPYGCDYNPDQWPAKTVDDDVSLMVQCDVNIVSLPIFGWVALEPQEGQFTFDWLDKVLDKLNRKGIRACMATATASTPAWLDQTYPDVLVTDENGVKRRHGNRHTFCPNSGNFRRLSTRLAQTIAERYKDHPALAIWHVSNEYGTHCYCEQCARAFRDWLQKRYKTLDELNARWYTAFWGHTYTDWSQIEPPFTIGERSMQALRIDYYRFQSNAVLGCFKAEADTLRKITPNVPVTTNLMGTFFNLDYYRWAKEMDVVSWDSYPSPGDAPSVPAFSHAVMRGLKEGMPFMLMEQSPSQANWQPYNRLKPPGTLRLQSFQAVAHGAESVMYFQWRRGRGACEKLHGAFVEHGGTAENRVFKETAQIGAELKSLGAQTRGGRVPAKTAILFDWESWWALSFQQGPSRDLDYLAACRNCYAALHGLGIQTDVVSPESDLSAYDLIVAPLLYMVRPKDAEKIEKRVKDGATLVATPFTGMVDETDLVSLLGSPGPLRKILGVFVEETDALPPDAKNGVRWTTKMGKAAQGTTSSAKMLCDRIRLEGAEAIGVYTDEFYAGEPAATVHRYGKGRGYYLATFLEVDGLKDFFRRVCAEKDIRSPLAGGAEPPKNVEVTARVSPKEESLIYLLNYGASKTSVKLEKGKVKDLLSGKSFEGAVDLPPLGVRILKKAK